MNRPMRQRARQVTDKAVLCAMLDQMEVLFLGIQDEPAPYVVPLNFGYDFEDDLIFYFHCARAGTKLDLLRADPHVCVTAAQFISYAGGSVKGHLHDYRSVIARGVAIQIDPEAEPEAFHHALCRLLIQQKRDAAQADTPLIRNIQMWKVVCKPEDVTAKAEIKPNSPEEVPFRPPVPDGIPLDESHIL